MELRRHELFTTIRTEGAILPPDLLQRIAGGDNDLGGLKPADYHLFEGEPLNEAIVRSWNRLVGAWAAFGEAQTRLPEGDLGTTITRERWLLILFDELAYGRLQPARTVEIDGKSYAASHRWGEHVPLHLVGCNVPLDHRSKGVAGAAAMSPHGLVQELLNRSEERLWGFVSNGLALRVLRDNSSLTRQAYVEFDLASMMDGEVYADFVVLWLVCHQSRVEGETPHKCWLERWSQEAAKQGTRALDGLRSGVEAAITALGTGFLAHPANTGLREALRSGELDKQEYYRELLRLAYRLLFLFVAEDRALLLDPGATAEAAARYDRFYSTRRLRRLAERRRGSKHADLYQGLRLAMERLGGDDGCPALGLPALGGYLWSGDAVPNLDTADLPNSALLDAVRALATLEERGVRRPVDYRNLGAEELGSVYESLLELRPDLNVDAAAFALTIAAGHERKTTGSYYTPTSLISCLLDSALEPVLEKAAAKGEHAILNLKVCDPACGSGHFLVAAAHRIAKRLASARTGDDEPSPEATRTALRDVVGRCLYGVDMNPMAVELCKVSLWMEALEPGKPLSFLDSHIKLGNSLVGTNPKLLAGGIPDDAFSPIEGDEKKIASEVRKRNKHEREGQLTFDEEVGYLTSALSEKASEMEAASDDSIEALHAKEQRFRALISSNEYESGRLLADAWCAAFLQRKTKDAPHITQSVLRQLSKSPGEVTLALRTEIERLRTDYLCFHWHIEFPDVFRLPEDGQRADNQETGWSGGFDLVLGNPPWDTLSPDRREFFSLYEPAIRSMSPAEQDAAIEQLLEDENIRAGWAEYRRHLLASVHFFKKSGRYVLFAPGNLGKGDFNIYRMFVEAALSLPKREGFAAQIVPAGLYGGANASAIRKCLLDQTDLTLLVGCENAGQSFFVGVHPQTWFCLYSARIGGLTKHVRIVFGATSPTALLARLAARPVLLPAALIREREPDTYAIPDVQDAEALTTIAKMYASWPAFGDESAGAPIRVYQTEIHMGNDRDIFTTEPSGLPLYEGRMIDRFDYRAKVYVSGHGNSAKWDDAAFGDPGKAIAPQWRIEADKIPPKLGGRPYRYRIGFGDIANPRNERSFVATLIPPGVLCGHTVPTILFEEGLDWAYLPWLAVANSFVMDALARKKLSSPHMTYTILDALPFPRLALDDWRVRYVAPRALRLVCTGSEMTAFWNAMGVHGWCDPVAKDSDPPGAVDRTRRDSLMAEIDAFVARVLFHLDRQEIETVLDSFPVLAGREQKAHGEYRTKRLILDAYDELGEAMADGKPNDTLLDLPPDDPRLAHRAKDSTAVVRS